MRAVRGHGGLGFGAQIAALRQYGRQVLRRRGGDLSAISVSWDLAVISGASDRVAVMYRKRIAEIGDVAAAHRRPAHPYTRRLFIAVPKIDGGEAESHTLWR